MDYHVWVRFVGGLSQAASKTRVNYRTQRSVVGDLGQPATGTDQQGVICFTLRLKRCTKADGEQFERTK